MVSLSSTSFSMYIAKAVPSIGSINSSLFATRFSSCGWCPDGGTCGPWALRRAKERAGAMGLDLERVLDLRWLESYFLNVAGGVLNNPADSDFICAMVTACYKTTMLLPRRQL